MNDITNHPRNAVKQKEKHTVPLFPGGKKNITNFFGNNSLFPVVGIYFLSNSISWGEVEKNWSSWVILGSDFAILNCISGFSVMSVSSLFAWVRGDTKLTETALAHLSRFTLKNKVPTIAKVEDDPKFSVKSGHIQLFVPVLSWDWSPLGFIHESTGTNVCDFENWIFDPAKAPNSRHRFRDCDACQRLALCKGSLPNSRHWLRDCDPHRIRDSDAGQRSADAKGTCEELTLLQLTHYTPLYVAAFHADIWVFFDSQRRPKFQRENRPRTALCSSTFVRLKPAGLHSRKYWNKCLWLWELNLWPGKGPQ